MKRINNVQHSVQILIDSAIKDLLSEYDKLESEKDVDITEIKGYVVDGRRGMAHLKEGYFTVPLWALKKGLDYSIEKGINDYFTYYTAHELSHILAYRKYNDLKGHHDFRFYEIFMKICPKEFQYHELHYKKSAVKYGIEK